MKDTWSDVRKVTAKRERSFQARKKTWVGIQAQLVNFPPASLSSLMESLMGLTGFAYLADHENLLGSF